jgi:hypothetical protein
LLPDGLFRNLTIQPHPSMQQIKQTKQNLTSCSLHNHNNE